MVTVAISSARQRLVDSHLSRIKVLRGLSQSTPNSPHPTAEIVAEIIEIYGLLEIPSLLRHDWSHYTFPEKDRYRLYAQTYPYNPMPAKWRCLEDVLGMLSRCGVRREKDRFLFGEAQLPAARKVAIHDLLAEDNVNRYLRALEQTILDSDAAACGSGDHEDDEDEEFWATVGRKVNGPQTAYKDELQIEPETLNFSKNAVDTVRQFPWYTSLGAKCPRNIARAVPHLPLHLQSALSFLVTFTDALHHDPETVSRHPVTLGLLLCSVYQGRERAGSPVAGLPVDWLLRDEFQIPTGAGLEEPGFESRVVLRLVEAIAERFTSKQRLQVAYERLLRELRLKLEIMARVCRIVHPGHEVRAEGTVLTLWEDYDDAEYVVCEDWWEEVEFDGGKVIIDTGLSYANVSSDA